MYVVRTLHYAIKYLDLTDWLKRTDVTATVQTADGELDKRIDELKAGKVIKWGTAKSSVDEEDPRYLNIYFKVKVGAILLKIKLYVDLNLFQGE